MQKPCRGCGSPRPVSANSSTEGPLCHECRRERRLQSSSSRPDRSYDYKRTAKCVSCGAARFPVQGKTEVLCHPCRRLAAGADPEKPMSSPTPPFSPSQSSCLYCGTVYTQTRASERYCSAACKSSRRRKKSRLRYDKDHRRERRSWEPLVATGGVQCHRPDCLRVAAGGSRLIGAEEPWDLGHDRATGAWRGPEHRSCNRQEGAAFRVARDFRSVGVLSTPGSSRW